MTKIMESDMWQVICLENSGEVCSHETRLGILTDYRGKGIETEFFKRLNVWAEENRVVRLELTGI